VAPLNQKKPEVRSEVCNLCSVVTETFGVLLLFGVPQCYSYGKIKSVIINCSSAGQMPNKPSVKSRTHKLFVALPSKHATFGVGSGRIFVRLLNLRSYRAVTVLFDKNGTNENGNAESNAEKGRRL
jgi:hypothetical protein